MLIVVSLEVYGGQWRSMRQVNNMPRILVKLAFDLEFMLNTKNA